MFTQIVSLLASLFALIEYNNFHVSIIIVHAGIHRLNYVTALVIK